MKMPDKKTLTTLAESARQAMQGAIAPYSHFRVGAALLTREGEVYTGCNVENPSLSLSVCAEKVALLKALSEGERDFSAIAVYADGMDCCTPCGSCRQMLFEFAPELVVVMVCRKGYKTSKIKELLPGAFKV